MNEIEKAKYSEIIIVESIRRLNQEDIRTHKSSDFSEDGYSIMLSIFIPFKKGYLLSDKKMRELILVLEGNYE